MRYRTIIFDLDGTLVDSYDALLLSVNHTRSHFGLAPFVLDTVKSMVGDGLGRLLERVSRLPRGVAVESDLFAGIPGWGGSA